MDSAVLDSRSFTASGQYMMSFSEESSDSSWKDSLGERINNISRKLDYEVIYRRRLCRSPDYNIMVQTTREILQRPREYTARSIVQSQKIFDVEKSLLSSPIRAVSVDAGSSYVPSSMQLPPSVYLHRPWEQSPRSSHTPQNETLRTNENSPLTDGLRYCFSRRNHSSTFMTPIPPPIAFADSPLRRSEVGEESEWNNVHHINNLTFSRPKEPLDLSGKISQNDSRTCSEGDLEPPKPECSFLHEDTVERARNILIQSPDKSNSSTDKSPEYKTLRLCHCASGDVLSDIKCSECCRDMPTGRTHQSKKLETPGKDLETNVKINKLLCQIHHEKPTNGQMAQKAEMLSKNDSPNPTAFSLVGNLTYTMDVGETKQNPLLSPSLSGLGQQDSGNKCDNNHTRVISPATESHDVYEFKSDDDEPPAPTYRLYLKCKKKTEISGCSSKDKLEFSEQDVICGVGEERNKILIKNSCMQSDISECKEQCTLSYSADVSSNLLSRSSVTVGSLREPTDSCNSQTAQQSSLRETWSVQNAVASYSSSSLKLTLRKTYSSASDQPTDEANTAFFASSRASSSSSPECSPKGPMLQESRTVEGSSMCEASTIVNPPTSPSATYCIDNSYVSDPSTPELSGNLLTSPSQFKIPEIVSKRKLAVHKASTPLLVKHKHHLPVSVTKDNMSLRRQLLKKKLSDLSETLGADSVLNLGFSIDHGNDGNCDLKLGMDAKLDNEGSRVSRHQNQTASNGLSHQTSTYNVKCSRTSIIQSLKRKLLCRRPNISILPTDGHGTHPDTCTSLKDTNRDNDKTEKSAKSATRYTAVDTALPGCYVRFYPLPLQSQSTSDATSKKCPVQINQQRDEQLPQKPSQPSIRNDEQEKPLSTKDKSSNVSTRTSGVSSSSPDKAPFPSGTLGQPHQSKLARDDTISSISNVNCFIPGKIICAPAIFKKPLFSKTDKRKDPKPPQTTETEKLSVGKSVPTVKDAEDGGIRFAVQVCQNTVRCEEQCHCHSSHGYFEPGNNKTTAERNQTTDSSGKIDSPLFKLPMDTQSFLAHRRNTPVTVSPTTSKKSGGLKDSTVVSRDILKVKTDARSVAELLATFMCDSQVNKLQVRVRSDVIEMLRYLCERCDITMKESASEPSRVVLVKTRTSRTPEEQDVQQLVRGTRRQPQGLKG